MDPRNRNPTLRIVFSVHGGHRFRPAVLAVVSASAGSLPVGHRFCLDCGCRRWTVAISSGRVVGSLDGTQAVSARAPGPGGTAATFFCMAGRGAGAGSVLAVLFAENGPCRATVESLAGAEAVHPAPPDQVGAALGALRFWRPIGIMVVALVGGVMVDPYGPGPDLTCADQQLGSILLFWSSWRVVRRPC